jgi:hypothetical protein
LTKLPSSKVKVEKAGQDNPKGDLKMDRAAKEIAAVEKTAAEAFEIQLIELNDLQLTLVGGGSAEVIFG